MFENKSNTLHPTITTDHQPQRMNGGTVQHEIRLAKRIYLLLSCVFNPRNDAAEMEIRAYAAESRQ